MGLPLVVVASPFLGTINHTLLTLDYALSKGLKVAGVVVNYARQGEGGPAEETNPAVIERLSPAPLLGIVQNMTDTGGDALEKSAVKHLDMAAIKRLLK
jgi:dethiobiotin synthetase